jgi:hypothetical protein
VDRFDAMSEVAVGELMGGGSVPGVVVEGGPGDLEHSARRQAAPAPLCVAGSAATPPTVIPVNNSTLDAHAGTNNHADAEGELDFFQVVLDSPTSF